MAGSSRLVALAVFLAACGGGGQDPVTPPPPGGESVPASLAIHSGDGQVAAAGSPVGTPAAVLVRDQRSQPMAGVLVSFSVDSGVGSVSGGPQATGADGIARAGTWTMGAGRSRLRAAVSGLPEVHLRAEGTGTVVVTEASVGTGGGTLTLEAQGSPVNGLTIEVPAAAFSRPVRWKLSLGGAPFPTRPGLNPITPTIGISSDATTYAEGVLAVRVPATVPAGSFPMVVMRDPATGALEGLPTLDYDAGSVTAGTRHLKGAFMMPPAGPPASRAARPASAIDPNLDVEITVSAIPLDAVPLTLDTGFRPGVDDWEFQNFGTTLSDGGTCAGMTVSSIWYYLTQKPARGALFGKYQTLSGVRESERGGRPIFDNPGGERLVSVVQEAVDLSRYQAHIKAMLLRALRTRTNPDVLFFNFLQANLYLTNLPALVTLADPDLQDGHAIVAWRTAGGRVDVADPNDPGDLSKSIRFTAGQFAPFVMPGTGQSDGVDAVYRQIIPVGLTSIIPLRDVAGPWAEFEAGTVASTGPHRMPESVLGTWGTSRIRDTVLAVDDTLRIWSSCPDCTYSFPSGVSPAIDHPQLNRAYANFGTDAAPHWKPTGVLTQPGDGIRLGGIKPGTNLMVAIQTYSAIVEGSGPAATFFPLWQDFRLLRVMRRKLVIHVEPERVSFGTPATLTAGLEDGEPPAEALYAWDFGDGSPEVRVDGSPEVEHAWSLSGGGRPDQRASYVVKVTLFDNANPGAPRRYATATATLAIGGAVTWRLTEFALQSATGTPGDNSTTTAQWQGERALFDGVAATPGFARMVLLPEGTPLPQCNCMIGFSGTLSTGETLWLHDQGGTTGSMYGRPSTEFTRNHALAGPDQHSQWSVGYPPTVPSRIQRSGELDDGAVTGRAVTSSWRAGGPQDPVDPVTLWNEVEAEMADSVMSGTVTLRVRWYNMTDTGVRILQSEGARVYRFRARREP